MLQVASERRPWDAGQENSPTWRQGVDALAQLVLLQGFSGGRALRWDLKQSHPEPKGTEQLCRHDHLKEVPGTKKMVSPMDGAGRSDAMYMVVPLLGVALLIIIGLFIIWRCQLQKATRRRPSYAQNRYLASRGGRSLPRAMACREALHGSGENPCWRDSGGRGPGDSRWCPPLPSQPESMLRPSEHSSSGLSQLSSATPPPSYEEVTRHPENSSSGEEGSLSYRDPPPKYEEIVGHFSASGK
uniref:Proline rich and Gla domain 3 n=1 Tax=Salvator merianae TaxID=96440 RepID=A0A8D0B6X2_SALMN